MDTPLDNPRWETYCQKRAEGLTQRQAMLAAFPSRVRWSDNAVDCAASKLEGKPKVKQRIAALQKAAADKAIATRTEILNGMTRTFRSATATERITQVTVQAVGSIGRTLLENLPQDTQEHGETPPVDFGLLIAPPFLDPHRAIAKDVGGEFWEFGGRYSGKSSHISLEIADGLRRHTDRSAYVVMRHQKDMRDAAFEQMLWAFDQLGMGGWQSTQQPLRLRNPATGQIVVFRGCDDAGKTKAVKAPAGQFFAYQWFGEVDQLRGMDEVRTVQQSVTRGAGPFFRFYDFNPPRSRDSWSNLEVAERERRGEPVYRSSYLDMPSEWVPQQVIEDAARLKEVNPQAYAHEWLGKATGYGNEVFDNVEVREITEAERRAISIHCYGVDWGFSQDPWAWVMVGYLPNTRTLYVLDELSGYGLSNSDSARMVSSRMGKTMVDDTGEVVEDAEPWAVVVCDSAEPKSIADYRADGIAAEPAPKTGAHNIRNSVRWLQDRTRIVIDPRCALAAREFPAWKYELTRDGNPTGAPEDANNHTIDAVRYACSTLIAERSYV